jgi:O-antigen/teichoic acid export membrane protein
MKLPFASRFALARVVSGAVLSQALLSAASLGVGLVLLRGVADDQYGLYILASGAILLLSSLQNAFLNPPLALRNASLATPQLGRFIAGLHAGQQRLLVALAGAALLLALVLWSTGLVQAMHVLLGLTTVAAGLVFLHREFFRMALFARRQSGAVLGFDLVYAIVLVGGAVAACFTPLPAFVAIAGLAVAALLSGIGLSRRYRSQEPWSTQPQPGLLADIAPLALWSTAGAAVHWLFSQGYLYLVAGLLDLQAVAAIAATRLVLMPVNLLSTGLGSLMMPLAATWLARHGERVLLQRLLMGAAALGGCALAYAGALWLLRDAVFDGVLHKQVADRDALLALWALVVTVMVVRDQLAYFIAATGRFQPLTLLTLGCAVVSLATSYVSMPLWGARGALVGLLVGEVLSVAGIATLIYLQLRSTSAQGHDRGELLTRQ